MDILSKEALHYLVEHGIARKVEVNYDRGHPTCFEVEIKLMVFQKTYRDAQAQTPSRELRPPPAVFLTEADPPPLEPGPSRLLLPPMEK
jgi:hypothetical protein